MSTIYKRPGSRLWQVRYLDRTGRKRAVSSGYTDKRAAEALGRDLEDRERRIRQGLVSPGEADAIEAARRPVSEHLDEHLDADERRGISERHRSYKRVLLSDFIAAERIETLAQVDPKSVSRHMARLVETGLSARTANAFRRDAIRFLNWCVETRRLSANPCPGRSVPLLNEQVDRRRSRRPFTEAELDRLFRHLGGEPRADAYRLALYTGLRRSELADLRWGDVDLDGPEPCLRLRASSTKAKRSEEVPLHRDASEVLQRLRGDLGDRPTGRVLPRIPTVHQLYRDLAAAGIQPCLGRRAEPDASGRVLDFHSFRATLATLLANRGVAPLHLKRIMRHASIETTDRHYTGLRLLDLGREIDRLGSVARLYTGMYTSDAPDPAFPCVAVREDGSEISTGDVVATLSGCGTSLRDAAPCVKAGDGIRTRDILLGRQRAETGNPGVSRGFSVDCTPECTPPVRRADLAALLAVLVELPPESVAILADLARKLRDRSAATG
jgi:integrase